MGITPIGETCKLGKGGLLNGPATLPSATYFARVSETIAAFLLAEGGFSKDTVFLNQCTQFLYPPEDLCITCLQIFIKKVLKFFL